LAAAPDVTTVDVGGEQVQIYPDEFDVLLIFAETNRGAVRRAATRWRRTAFGSSDIGMSA
jgi:hypothetical protein